LQQRANRILRAAIISPLAAAPIFITWYLIFRFFFMEPGDLAEPWPMLFVFLVYVLIIAYAASFLVAIPIDWFLRRLGVRSPIAYATAGGAFGGIIGVTLLPPSHLSLAMLLCGVVIGLAFRAVASVGEEPPKESA